MPDPVREVRRRIAEAADADRAPRMQAYMKSAMPFGGVGSVLWPGSAATCSAGTSSAPVGPGSGRCADPDWVRSFVATHAASLSGLTRREARKNLPPQPTVEEPAPT